ncbi:DNA polymerase III, alpha subunit [Faunimonas pinastri]|uniref:DNA polymerase III subunit alpha n=1 Tax=Faunimonas pinastri TaxID=1855383 RepID=A0A1H9J7R1_9HYPH|nr:DNA polymerase III subunit alpha [Faunimonas pinastri]SEQ82822.1 DNA polymerase III, alpha subunit [Faunimonas pinastri]
MPGGPDFIHLNCHSAYSLLEGALPLGKLIDLAVKSEMPALGITDTANLFGALEFSEKAVKAGLQPIVGCKLPVRFEVEDEREAMRPGQQNRTRRTAPIFLFCASPQGYADLMKLVSHFYVGEDGRGEPVSLARLQEASRALIALTGGHDGPLYHPMAEGEGELAATRLENLKNIFDDRLYVSLERHGMDVERDAEAGVVDLAYAMDLPLVATNEPMFPKAEDYEAHDALLSIADGRLISSDDRRRLTPEHHFASQAEMKRRFQDLPEALENTVEVALRCHARVRTVNPILPRFAAKAEDPEAAEREEAAELCRQAEEGLIARLDKLGTAPGLTREDYEKRLEFELGIITKMKFPGYFLIVADFIKWAKQNGIPVGPGRGSGAGSVVAWALTITDLDPLRFALLFERFLNPERVSMPDFDIDFCQDRREEVIGYVQKRYGSDQVAQIITFGTLQARAALRDVGRVLEMPYGQVDRLSKMVPADPANPVTLAQAVADEPRFAEARQEEPVVDRLLTIAMKLEGLYRHASTHAAGIVIGDRPLDQLVPLYRDPRSALPVTQFNMKWVEQAGLVKFDFLGLKTLTTLRRAVDLIARRGIDIDLSALPLEDKKTFEMLGRGETVGVFQLESQGMRRALAGMKADRFEDIIALVALYRPGPMDNIPTYNRRKHGEEEPDYLHPRLEPILKETYGVIIYQEQVMQIAQTLSGYSLGDADLLRRAMGKKIKAEMDAQRARFVEGAVTHDVVEADASMIFDLVAKFASYGFNKSHAAAYALVAYQTAYLKANYPVEFLAASMTLDMGNTDKLNEFRLEARRLGIDVIPPDINRSRGFFDVADGKIVYALSALKGVGSQVIEHIVEVREGGPFRGLDDFVGRIDPRIVNRRTMECLVQAGAFDRLEPNRSLIFGNVGRLLAAAQERVQRVSSGVGDLFGEAGSAPAVTLAEVEAWTPTERLQREFTAIGAYLSAHPLDEYQDVVKARGGTTWKAFFERLRSQRNLGGLLAVTVVQRVEKRTKTGGRLGIVTLSDPTGQFEATVYQERLFEWREQLEPGQSLMMQIGAEFDPETEDLRVRILGLEQLEAVAARRNTSLRVFLDRPASVERLQNRLNEPGEGSVSLILLLDQEGREVEMKLPGHYRVTPHIAGAIKALPGVVQVELM